LFGTPKRLTIWNIEEREGVIDNRYTIPEPFLVGLGENFPTEENHVFGCYSAETGSKRWGHMQPNIWKSCVHVAIINFATKHIKKFATKHVKKFV